MEARPLIRPIEVVEEIMEVLKDINKRGSVLTENLQASQTWIAELYFRETAEFRYVNLKKCLINSFSFIIIYEVKRNI